VTKVVDKPVTKLVTKTEVKTDDIVKTRTVDVVQTKVVEKPVTKFVTKEEQVTKTELKTVRSHAHLFFTVRQRTHASPQDVVTKTINHDVTKVVEKPVTKLVTKVEDRTVSIASGRPGASRAYWRSRRSSRRTTS
jgi:membrane carboxypeptidase/penicillin-binding protein PbpC